MPHTIEPAASGRAKCRGCGRTIAKGDLRFGERLPNPYADEGEMTLWFHLLCGAYKRPEPLLEALGESAEEIADKAQLAEAAVLSQEHRRLPRIAGTERASSARASCRSCRTKIPKGAWRVRLAFFEGERFTPSGFVHMTCAPEYFGTADLLGRLGHFTPELEASDLAEIEIELVRGPEGASDDS